MKKLTLILALATLALFTQCKKQDPTQDNPTNGIRMVLKADNGGSKTDIGADGYINWKTNEKIYVVCNGQCVGQVTNGTEGGSTFTGTLTGIAADGTYDFHYYYVGNTQTIETGNESFTMDFSDQDGTLANLGDFHVGYGLQTGVEVTTGETVTTQAHMKSLVSIAYFDLAGMAETGEMVYFYGDHINNQMTIDFSSNAPTYGKTNEEGQNLICAGAVAESATSPCYVMLLPNHTDGTEELTTNITFISKRTTGTCNDVFNYGIVGGRFYCKDGDTDTPIALDVASYDEGALRGEFSVSATQTVRFSQGNLQYIGSATTPYWKFAENQWDYLGTSNGHNGADVNVDRDLFRWGTSGYNYGPVCYQPWSTSGNNDDYYAGNLFDMEQSDWGYNAINNGGNQENCGWRTLTMQEWKYVFNSRGTTSGIRYAKAIVNDCNGIILLPNDWADYMYGLHNTNATTAMFISNKISAEDWTRIFEVNGAVFLPAAGYTLGLIGSYGFYWSSTRYGNDQARHVKFYKDDLLTSTYNSGPISNKSSGLSVRLIRNIE